VLDDLHEQLASVRVEAALVCDPLDPQQREALAREMAALPTAQLEAALGLILPQVGGHGGWAGESRRVCVCALLALSVHH